LISIYFECAPEKQDELAAELYSRGTLGILELPSGLRAWFEQPAGLSDVIELYDGEVTDEPASNEDWVQRMQDSFPPFAIGKQLWLTPPWNNQAAPEGRIRLEILPGAACGTGWHECTQMCLELLERTVTPGSAVLDVGSGSGILSVAARLLGAGRVISCDIDEDAARISKDRLESATVYVGSAQAAATGQFDIVVANIGPDAIREMESDLRRVARAQGTIIVSGFGDYPLDAPPRESIRRGEWLCAVL
jgi:ribosomal protein L11 methyltransferase